MRGFNSVWSAGCAIVLANAMCGTTDSRPGGTSGSIGVSRSGGSGGGVSGNAGVSAGARVSAGVGADTGNASTGVSASAGASSGTAASGPSGAIGSAGASGAAGSGVSMGGDDGGARAGAKFDHLVMILMENHNLNEIYGTASYLTKLADEYALLKNYTAIDHPSEPNYLAIASGQTFNPPSGDDAYHVFMARNIVDGLESVGLIWRAYSESASGPCDTSNPDVRHVPFVFFSDVASSVARCGRVIPTTANTDTEMIAELNSATAANLIWLTPNDDNNMHNGTIARGDSYLQYLVPKILGSTTFMTKRAALFVVYDEGKVPFPNDFVYAVWAGPVVKKMHTSTTTYTHYSVLATLEANWGFPTLTAMDAQAPSMMEVFQ